MNRRMFFAAAGHACLGLSCVAQENLSDFQNLAGAEHSSVRLAAAMGLRDFVVRFGHAKMLPLYKSLLTDPAEDVVKEALIAVKRTPMNVGSWSTPREVEAFIDTLHPIVLKLRTSSSPEIVRLAGEALLSLDRQR